MRGWPLVLFILPCIFGTLAHPCFAQNNDTPAAANSASAPAPNAAANPAIPAPRKIWTNDDVPSSRPAPSAADKRATNSRTTPAQTVDMAAVQRIRTSLAKLQAQLEDVNKKLKAYKEFQQGEPVSTADRELNKGINRVPVEQQMIQLQDKKKQLEAQIGDLYDEARKKGIDPGLLR